jgi:hypothetical protein
VTRLLAAAVLLATLPLPAAAITIPTYRAQASAGLDGQTVEDGTFASAQAGGAYANTATAEGSAKADGLGLGAGGRAAVPGRTLDGDVDGVWNSASISGGGSARFRIDDLVFSRDDPTDTRPVPVAALLPIDGVFSFSRPEGSNARVTASVGVDYGLGVPGVGSTAIVRTIGSILYGENGNAVGVINPIHIADGIFEGLEGQSSIDGVFQTPVFDIPVNVAVVMSVTLRAGASAVARDGAAVEALSNFMYTLAFLPGEPVFVLPGRVSVRSVTAGIDGNRWPGGSPNNPPAPVPLPPAAGLLAAALAGLSLIARRR